MKISRVIIAQQNAPLPKAWGVLYAKPNSDNSKKSCLNCWKWSQDNKCLEFNEDVQVTQKMVCGLHAFGQPRTKWEKGGENDPELAGLETIPEGTSCGSCKFYSGDSEKGNCSAVASEETNEPPQEVQFFGCCARWSKI